METKESDNLNKAELFEVLKDKCKSIVKSEFYCGLIGLILVILTLLFRTGKRPDDPEFIVELMPWIVPWIVVVCLTGWVVLNSYLMLKRIDNLDTPDQLLRRFKKTCRYNTLFLSDAWIIMIIFCAMTGVDYWSLAFWIVFTVVIIFGYYKNLGLFGTDKEMIKQLQELVEKK